MEGKAVPLLLTDGFPLSAHMFWVLSNSLPHIASCCIFGVIDQVKGSQFKSNHGYPNSTMCEKVWMVSRVGVTCERENEAPVEKPHPEGRGTETDTVCQWQCLGSFLPSFIQWEYLPCAKVSVNDRHKFTVSSPSNSSLENTGEELWLYVFGSGICMWSSLPLPGMLWCSTDRSLVFPSCVTFTQDVVWVPLGTALGGISWRWRCTMTHCFAWDLKEPDWQWEQRRWKWHPMVSEGPVLITSEETP